MDVFAVLREAKQRTRNGAVEPMPVKSGCICPNQHKPVNGIVITSPACLEHGLRSPWICHEDGFDVPWQETVKARTEGHSPRLPVLRDARLADATRRCGAKLAARAAHHPPSTPTGAAQ